MEILRKNYKEDLKLLVSLGDKYSGEAFSIRFTSGRFGIAEYICSYDGAEYVNCDKVDDTHVVCYLDNHGLPCGFVSAEVRVGIPDAQMPDGELRLVSKGLLQFDMNGTSYHLELTEGVSDGAYIGETEFNILSNFIKGKDAVINGYNTIEIIGDAVKQEGEILTIDAYDKATIDQKFADFSPAPSFDFDDAFDIYDDYDELYDDNDPVRTNYIQTVVVLPPNVETYEEYDELYEQQTTTI